MEGSRGHALDRALRRLVDQLPEIAWSARADGEIDCFNERWFAFTGTTSETMLERGWRSVLRPDLLPNFLEAWQRARETGEPIEVEIALRGADGAFRAFLSRVRPLRDDAGEIVRWLGICTEIDQLQRLRVNQRLLLAVGDMAFEKRTPREILEQIPSMFVPDFADGCMVYSPPKEDLPELVGISHVVPEKAALLDQMIPYVRAASAAQPSPKGRELRAVAQKQTPILVAPFTDQLRVAVAQSPDHLALMRALDLRAYLLVPVVVDGETSAIFSLLNTESDRSFSQEDIQIVGDFANRIGVAVALARAAEERELRAEAERRAKEEAERAAALAELLVGMLGHDLRGPLQAIMTGASLFSDDAQDDQTQRVAERVLNSSRKMSRLVDKLLDFSRIRAGRGLPCHPTPGDLEEVVSRMQEELPGATGRLVVTRKGRADGTWDADRLAQMLSNLLGNALQYSPPGSFVSVAIDGRAERTIEIVIENVGAVPAELVDVIFEPFQRGATPKGGRRSGLGLGLYIAKESVIANGGAIALEPTADDTTRFRIVLPREASPPSNPDLS